MDAVRTGLLLAATLTTGLVAGLFYAFSISVLPALRATPAAVLVEVMQRVNRAILNGWFFLCFVGALVLGLAAAILAAVDGDPGVLAPATIGFLLYAVQIVVTRTVNIPLNDALDAAGTTDPEAARRAFEARWVRWNHVRTWLCTVSFGAWTWALLAA